MGTGGRRLIHESAGSGTDRERRKVGRSGRKARYDRASLDQGTGWWSLLRGQVSSRQLFVKQVVEGRCLNPLLLGDGKLSKNWLPVFQRGQVQRNPAGT